MANIDANPAFSFKYLVNRTTRICSGFKKLNKVILGAQRPGSIPRARQIANYIDTVEAAFPNSIILAANYINDGELQENPEKRWRVEESNGRYTLIIPTLDQMASVIDGQHRLLGFDFCKPERQSMELLCSVYIDLPQAYQAYLFATININQRKVDKSLAYEQFGYNLDKEKSDSWSPDKLAVSITRHLNLDPESPFYRHIKITPIDTDEIFKDWGTDWQVSTAAIVEGLIRLISSNPKRDRDALHKLLIPLRSRERLPTDSAPYRKYYSENRDEEFRILVNDFFKAVAEQLWSNAPMTSYIRKTIGIQALFDVLRFIGTINRTGDYNKILKSCAQVDFSDPFYQASGKGRVRVKNTILLLAGLTKLDEIQGSDVEAYRLILNRYSR
jgi:DNA phosphorothioation-associated DGQHR protein 1